MDVLRLSVSPRAFRRLAASTAGGYALLVVTGGAVRLTGSGLGCPDWPSCYTARFTPQLSLHPEVEFANRLVTVVISILSVAILLAALSLSERRRDLTSLSLAIVGGLVAQIVLGGIVVLAKLNPYLVALHFALTFLVLAVAIVLLHRSGRPLPIVPAEVDPALLWLSRLVLGVLGVLVCLGTVVTGSGPHAGAPGTSRIDVAFRDIAEAHSTVALFLIGLVLALLFALRLADQPDLVFCRARSLFELLALQGIIGYTQYFLHDASGIIELHLAGVTAVWWTAITYYLKLRQYGLPARASRPMLVDQLA